MADRRETNSSGALAILQALLASIGATGVLVAIGYIVAYSREHLLGIDIIRARAAIDYASIGARFFGDVAVLLYRHAAEQIVELSIVLGLMIAAYFVARRIIILPPLRFRSLYLLLMLILLIGKLAYFDIPFVFQSDILIWRFDDIPCNNILNCHANRLWNWFLCRHGAGQNCGAAQRELESLFVWNVIATAVLAYLTLSSLRRRQASDLAPDREPLSGPSLSLLTAFVLLLSVLSVPYTYGRCAWSAQTPDVEITLNDSKDAPQDPVYGLLLAQDEQSVLVYEKNLITEYSRSDVKSIRLRGRTKDLVNVHIARISEGDETTGNE